MHLPFRKELANSNGGNDRGQSKQREIILTSQTRNSLAEEIRSFDI